MKPGASWSLGPPAQDPLEFTVEVTVDADGVVRSLVDGLPEDENGVLVLRDALDVLREQADGRLNVIRHIHESAAKAEVRPATPAELDPEAPLRDA